MANKTVNLIRELGFEAANKFLSEELFIQVKEYDNFFVYNYNQIFSPEDNDYVMECRSLQIDKFGNVISRAYPRFFNRGQCPEITGKFVFKGSKVMNKVDGSLIRIYFNMYDNRWEIATRGTAFAESGQDFYPTFREAVLSDGFGKTEEEFQEFAEENLSPTMTYVFEYCSRKNRIVTYYPEPVMYLITMIENTTGTEYDVFSGSYICTEFLAWSRNVQLIGYLEFNSADELLTALENLPDLQEGFVSKDINGLRIKYKNSLYLKCHRLRGDTGFTPKKIATVVVENEQDEVLTYFPEYTDMFVPYIEKFGVLMESIRNVWETNKNIETQRDFALAIKDYDFSSLLFNMRKTGKDLATCWDDVRLEFKIGLLIDGDVDE